MATTKIAVNGAAGRMGRRVIAMVARDDECELVCALEREDDVEMSRDAGEVAGIGPIGVDIGTELRGAPDVLIDFSTPASCLKRLEECAAGSVAAVVGTTGFDDDEKERLEFFSEQIPVLVAPNMSLGVNVMFRLAPQVAASLGKDYDIEIIESHHREKKDAPSGTARKLAEAICTALGRRLEDVVTHGRVGLPGRRPDSQIGVHAVRGGDIVGEHTVIFAGEGERIELTHRAGSRNVFATGAVNAARFINRRNPGLYDIDDMLLAE